MGFSWLDGLIILVVTAVVLWELRRDLGQSLFDTVALLLGLRLAVWVGPGLSHCLSFATPSQGRGLALLALFVVGAGLGLLLGYHLNNVTRWTMDSFDRVAGALLGFSSAVIVCHVLVASITLIFAHPAGPPQFVAQSRLGQEALSFRTFEQVIHFFNGLRT